MKLTVLEIFGYSVLLNSLFLGDVEYRRPHTDTKKMEVFAMFIGVFLLVEVCEPKVRACCMLSLD